MFVTLTSLEFITVAAFSVIAQNDMGVLSMLMNMNLAFPSPHFYTSVNQEVMYNHLIVIHFFLKIINGTMQEFLVMAIFVTCGFV